MAQVSHGFDDEPRRHRGSGVRAWLDVFQLVAVIALFVCGVVFRPSFGNDLWPQSWNAAFVALGFLCLGFGAGMLVYRRRQRADTTALRDDYADLAKHARLLGEEMDSLLERTRKQGT